MEKQALKKKFNTLRLNQYIEQLDNKSQNNFWSSIQEIKEIFPNIDIYNAGFSKYGYLGIGTKLSKQERVKDFILVSDLNANYDEVSHFYIQFTVINALAEFIGKKIKTSIFL